MFVLLKLSTVALFVSFLFSPTNLFAPPFEELEKKFPLHFRGFAKTDFEFVENYRHTREGVGLRGDQALFEPNPQLREKFESFQRALEEIDREELNTLKIEVAQILENPKKQTAMYYICCLARACMLLSEPREEEQQFFRAAGFPDPYEHLGTINPDDDFLQTIAKLGGHDIDTRGAFERTKFRRFFDPGSQGEKILEQNNPFRSVPYFMLCTQPKEDIFGFFYLAMMYSQGIHPIPATLKEEGGELHGIRMTLWAKMCHDLAHSEGDPADYSVAQFSNFLVNHYLKKLEEKLPTLSIEEKKKYSVTAMLPHMTNFALAIHTAYRQSLVAILERSISHYGIAKAL